LTPRLLKPTKPKGKKQSRRTDDSWEGVHSGLFERLRQLRRELADARSVPAYIVFGDAALRDMARLRPSSIAQFLLVKGVGEKKLADYGQVFVDAVVEYCREHQVEMDVV
jgi:ATP-dependent DNA helicase RecQ